MNIPKNLEECINTLDSMNIEDIDFFLKETEENATSMAHHTIGQWIRNNWDLWSVTNTPFWENSLVDYFNNLDIHHPDDMSSIILLSFHRQKNGKEIKLEEQIEVYKKFWKKNKK